MWKERITTLQPKKLIGRRLRMSVANDKTHQLWRSFMSDRGKIKNNVSEELISMRVYDEPFRMDFQQEFDKWAAVEVLNFSDVPEGMETFVLKEGLYAVFDYKGLNTDHRIYHYIFAEWLPDSGYLLDNRPQFEILGSRYRNNDPASEEEIWIPVSIK
jgi:AraC family transcriptional regulator